MGDVEVLPTVHASPILSIVENGYANNASPEVKKLVAASNYV